MHPFNSVTAMLKATGFIAAVYLIAGTRWCLWLTDYVALGMPGAVTQLQRSRAWFKARWYDTDIRLRMAEGAFLKSGDGPADPTKGALLLAEVRKLKHEQRRFRQALAQMQAPQVEPEA